MRVIEGTYVPSKEIGFGKGFAVHAEETKAAMGRCGVTFVKELDNADVVLHQAPAMVVKRVEGKPNIIYTAWETENLPQNWIDVLNSMDLVIATSTFTEKVFKRYIKTPVVKVNLGVDQNIFKYKKRKVSGPFVFMWLGAPNARKGWTIVGDVWQQFSHRRDLMLFMKTTNSNISSGASGNVYVNTDHVSKEQLRDMYYSANCFLFPSYGEGFGLPLAEAMATGLPCIYTPYSGVLDFANSKNAYPLTYKKVPVVYSIDTYGAEATVSSLTFAMVEVIHNYRKALIKGKRASLDIRKKFTWDHTGRNIKKALEDFLNGKLH